MKLLTAKQAIQGKRGGEAAAKKETVPVQIGLRVCFFRATFLTDILLRNKISKQNVIGSKNLQAAVLRAYLACLWCIESDCGVRVKMLALARSKGSETEFTIL